jgi:hypothetical protein
VPDAPLLPVIESYERESVKGNAFSVNLHQYVTVSWKNQVLYNAKERRVN